MFQYQWFNPKKYKKTDALQKVNNTFFFDYNDISAVRLSNWQEHCLECAPPYCYHHCEKYVEREDKKCSNLVYGMHWNEDFKEYPFAAEFKWRVWSKIETKVYPAVLDLNTVTKLDKLNRVLEKFVKNFSRAIRFISPYYRLSGALTFYTHKFLCKYKKHTNKATDTFLFQCYSYEKPSVNLCFDLLNQGSLCFRGTITLKNGFNQTILTMPKDIDLSKMRGLVRIYPENNFEPHVTILFCDFVKLKMSGKATAPKAKCVIWDLDNTIWDGILIESEPNSLQLRKNVLNMIKTLDQKGIIQSIASKNNHDEAMKELERLGIAEYFIYPMINWDIKSSNIETIAKRLNIDANTFIFIDDSVFERNEVLSNHPYVRVYDEKIIDYLNELEELDVPITEESKKRREMYQKEAKRKENYAAFFGSNIDFLKQCQLQINIFIPTTDDEILRCYELIQRTNQLNLSAKKYSKEEFEQKISDKNIAKFAITCEDKYGSYGQIAFMLFHIEENSVKVTEFAMSCRVAGKHVESAILKWLQQKFNKDILFKGTRTDKNILLVNSLIDSGMKDLSDEREKICLGLGSKTEPVNAEIVRFTQTHDKS